MRNKFTNPVMSISTFDTENIVTLSGTELHGAVDATSLQKNGYLTAAATYDATQNILNFQ